MLKQLLSGLCVMFCCIGTYAQDPYGLTTKADSFNHSEYLMDKAVDLSVNEQYESAVAKSTEALKYNRFNGRAYMTRAFAQWDLISNSPTKDAATLNAIINDLNSSLKFHLLERNTNIYRIRALARNALGNDEQAVNKDLIEARLEGNEAIITACNNMKKSSDLNAKKLFSNICQTPGLTYSISFTDGNIANAKITINNTRLSSDYKLLHLNADQYSVLVVIDYQEKSIWYSAIKTGENGTHVEMTKFSVSEFLGDYLNVSFMIKDKTDKLLTSAFPFLEIKVDFAGKKVLQKEEYEVIRKKKIADKELTSYSILSPIISIVL